MTVSRALADARAEVKRLEAAIEGYQSANALLAQNAARDSTTIITLRGQLADAQIREAELVARIQAMGGKA